MGDYNVLIVSAGLIKPADKTREQFEAEINERIPRTDSAYHATAPFVQFSREWERRINISAIVQAKWNSGVPEFLDWLEPFVCQGVGADEVWAINYSEYSGEPTVRKLTPTKEREL